MAASTVHVIQDILKVHAAERPDKVALICENQRLTFGQIDGMASRLANAFRKNGVQSGDRVLFHLLNSSELVVGVFAALKANAAFCVLDYASTFDTLRSIAADSQASALVTFDHQAEAAGRLLGELPCLRFVVLVGKGTKPPDANLLTFDAIQKEFRPDPIPQQVIDRDLACLIYTSGSTGQAKGVMVTHRSSLFTIDSGVEYLGLSERDIHTSPLPLSFGAGINQLLQAFRVGGTLILEKSFAFPHMTLSRMAAEGATGFAAVPAILALLLKTDLGRYDFSRLRFMSSIGAALPPATIQQIRQRLPHVSLCSTYGMVEVPISLGLDPAQIDRRPTSVGKPFPGTQAWVVDENGQRLGPGQRGELVVRGSHVRSGYWNDPAATAQRFRPGPLPDETVCFTGDIFVTDEEGYFYFIGRSDEIIKSGARKVVPGEIENALRGLPGVLEAAVIGIPDPVLGQAVKAFVVLDESSGISLTVEEILGHCHESLEGFKVPRQIEIRHSLPKTSNGKIKKTDLAKEEP